MNKTNARFFVSILFFVAASLPLLAKQKDPVVATVNGKKILKI